MPISIDSKYSIGQEVFIGDAPWSPTREQCPDCLGSGKWNVTTPKGEAFEVPCNTCWEGYHATGTILVYGYNPLVERRTVGSIRINTSGDEPVEYMCNETGVGCGRVYRESSLFATREEAEAYAAAKAAENVEKLNSQEEEKRLGKKKERVRRLAKSK